MGHMAGREGVDRKRSDNQDRHTRLHVLPQLSESWIQLQQNCLGHFRLQRSLRSDPNYRAESFAHAQQGVKLADASRLHLKDKRYHACRHIGNTNQRKETGGCKASAETFR